MTPREPFDPSRIPDSPALIPDRAASRTVTVSQLTMLVKTAIESSLPTTLHVIGEISNFKRHTSGHLYFTLKDKASELSTVMWRSAAARLKFDPADGLEVVCTGTVEVFERAGRYQLYVRRIEPRGVGALELAFRQLYEKLSAEGLFEDSHKRPIPRYPTRIVLVTSPTGAAVSDMINTIERRFPCVHLLIYPVRVQGEGASEEIASAIRRVNTRTADVGGVDVMIVGRGGGSLEDLWAFNEEQVARAIYASRIPIISAVGHEVDVSIADLVADVRAATPTAAAELAVPVLDEVLEHLDAVKNDLSRSARRRMEIGESRLASTLAVPPFREPIRIVHLREQGIDELALAMERSTIVRLRRHWRTLDAHGVLISQIHPQRHLWRTVQRLHKAQDRLYMAASSCMSRAGVRVVGAAQRLDHESPRRTLLALTESVRAVRESIRTNMQYRLTLGAESIRRLDDLLTATSHRHILRRGYSITRTKKGNLIVQSLANVADGDRLVTEVSDGKFESEVVSFRQMELFES